MPKVEICLNITIVIPIIIGYWMIINHTLNTVVISF
jgi:hypothetical protein